MDAVAKVLAYVGASGGINVCGRGETRETMPVVSDELTPINSEGPTATASTEGLPNRSVSIRIAAELKLVCKYLNCDLNNIFNVFAIRLSFWNFFHFEEKKVKSIN